MILSESCYLKRREHYEERIFRENKAVKFQTGWCIWLTLGDKSTVLKSH